MAIDARTYSKGEVDMAKELYHLMMDIPYFREHPTQLKLIATEEEEFVRFTQMAILEKGTSKEAVLILGTLDEPALSQKVRESDLQNAKGALAASVRVMERLSETLDDGCVVLMNVCDRYGGGLGMEAGLQKIREMQEAGYTFRAALTTHDTLSRGEHAVFFGSQACLRPAVYIAGKQVRTPAFSQGLDPAYILSTVVRDLTLNAPMMEKSQSEVSEPIYVNRMIVPGGTEFTTAGWGYASFTTSSLSRSPVEYIRDLKEHVCASFAKAMDELNTKYAAYCLKQNHAFAPIDVKRKVYTWDEYLNELVTVRGYAMQSAIRSKKDDILRRDPDLSGEELRLRLVHYIYEEFRLADEPIVILYFEDLPMHRVDVTGTTAQQQNLMLAVTAAVYEVDPSIRRRFFYPEMSYHAYLSSSDDTRDLKEALKFIPEPEETWTDRIRMSDALGIPAANMGGTTMLVDGRYIFDRTYQLETVPKLMESAIRRILR